MSTSLALYQIAEQYRDAANKLAELDLPEDVVRDTLEALSGDLQTKAVNVVAFTRNLEGSAEQIRKAIAAMEHRCKVLENRAEAIREYIKRCMETAGIQKIDCPYFELAIVKNPPSLEIDPDAVIPDRFLRRPPPPPPAPDKKAILDYMKENPETTDLQGVRLVQKTRLRVK